VLGQTNKFLQSKVNSVCLPMFSHCGSFSIDCRPFTLTQKDSQTVRHTDSQTHSQTYRQSDTQSDTQTYRQTQTVGQSVSTGRAYSLRLILRVD